MSWTIVFFEFVSHRLFKGVVFRSLVELKFPYETSKLGVKLTEVILVLFQIMEFAAGYVGGIRVAENSLKHYKKCGDITNVTLLSFLS